MKHYSILTAFLLTIFLSSCATIFGGRKNTIKISGNNSKSEVYLDGEYLGLTPLKMRISKYKLQEGSVIEIRKHGYQSCFYTVNRRPHVGYVLLNILSGSIPLIVDVANGNIYRPNTRNIEFDLPYDTLGTIKKIGNNQYREVEK